MSVTPINQCILYAADVYDSHAGYDMDSHIYTFRMSGKYLVKDKDGLRMINALVGDRILEPYIVISENCTVFFHPKNPQ